MSYRIAAVAALASLVSTVSAHGYLQSVVVAGTDYSGWNNTLLYTNSPPQLVAWSDTVNDNGFVSDFYSPDIICHKGAQNAKLSAPINGGESVTFQWENWPTDHKGDVITYLANCNGDCSTVDKTSLKWFKIDQAGLLSGDSVGGTWATDKLIADGHKWTVKIPETIASGNYVARHEIIALHVADRPQNYPQCINLQIKSSGSDNPEGVPGQSLYTSSVAGLVLNIFWPVFQSSSCTIPGPALYVAGSGSAAPAPAPAPASTFSTAYSSVAAYTKVAAPAWTAPAWSSSTTSWTSEAPATTVAAVYTPPGDDEVYVTEIDYVTDVVSTTVYVNARHRRARHN
jgi:cellulase